MDFEISLAGLDFHAYHGVFNQERRVGNRFVVDVSVRFPYNENILDDNLADSISYADIFQIVAEEMSRPRNLLETVAATMVSKIKETWPFISSGHVTICKSTPPIANCTGAAKVTLFF
ncbi:MAG: dihydroneopterin aldolase [Muribaculaceae bacterium]|nr:dihydroneopterin aldolase [Muribaculaceae bacterium]